jgi:hypothetical protein
MLKNNEVNNTTKKFIQQAINFEDYMLKLTFGTMLYLSSKTVEYKYTQRNMFKLSIEKTKFILFS